MKLDVNSFPLSRRSGVLARRRLASSVRRASLIGALALVGSGLAVAPASALLPLPGTKPAGGCYYKSFFYKEGQRLTIAKQNPAGEEERHTYECFETTWISTETGTLEA